MTNTNTILVTGATGKQGGGVAKQLAQNGFTVKALTRNPASAKAQQLKAFNIQIIKGDLNDVNSYIAELKDVYGVFSVQTFENGINKEIHQGTALATIAKKYNIKHFLYSSVAGAELQSGVPHFESKFKIENHIRQIGLPFTILRPASFYENFLIPHVKKGILKGKLIQPVNSETVLCYMAAVDIGKIALKIFESPEKYIGKTIPLATEQLSTLEVAEIFSEVMGRRIEYKKLPALIIKLFLGSDLNKMFKWTDAKNRFHIETVEETRTEFRDLLDLRNWIKQYFR
jgi:uncharacterized protein YbjT (DUF2867 family)